MFTLSSFCSEQSSSSQANAKAVLEQYNSEKTDLLEIIKMTRQIRLMRTVNKISLRNTKKETS